MFRKLRFLALLGMAIAVLDFHFVFPCPAREIDLTILHTADLHGHLDSVPVEGSTEQAGGLLRCAAVIDRARAEAANVVLVDCGDLFQGSAESFLSGGEAVMRAVTYLRYDGLVVGNHEFDWGVDRLRALYRKADIPVLSAGITVPEKDALPHACPFIVKQFEGIKLVVVGLSNPSIPNWSRPRLLDDLRFADSVDALRGVMPEVRALEPDILVLAVHQGWRQWGDDRANEVNRIARTFPDFDLIIGAHTHTAVEGAEVNRIIYTQAGYYGLWLGKVSLTFDDRKRQVTRIKPQLIAVGADVPPDEKLQELVAEPLRAARAYLGRKVGASARELGVVEKSPGQSEVQTLIAAAIAGSAGADVVFHGALTTAGLPRGILRMADVWRIVPYENTLARARLTLEEIREVLEENSKYYGKTQFRGVYGLTYELNRKAVAGRRVSNLQLDDHRELKENERISFAVNSYDLASAGGRFPRLREIMERPGSKLEETDKDTREAVIDYLKRNSPLDIQAAPGVVVAKSRRKGTETHRDKVRMKEAEIAR